MQIKLHVRRRLSRTDRELSKLCYCSPSSSSSSSSYHSSMVTVTYAGTASANLCLHTSKGTVRACATWVVEQKETRVASDVPVHQALVCDVLLVYVALGRASGRLLRRRAFLDENCSSHGFHCAFGLHTTMTAA